MKKKYILFFVSFLIIFFLSKSILITQLNNQNKFIINLKEKIDPNIKYFLKQTLFKNYALKKELKLMNDEIIKLNNEIKELYKFNSGKIFFNKNLVSENKEEFNLKKFFMPNASKIYNDPTTYWNYIDDFENNIIIALSSGKLFFFDKKDLFTNDLNIKIIESNLGNFVKINHQQSFADTVKDILIEDNRIYISYVREVSENCYGNAILEGKMNLSNIKFSYFFKNEQCIVDSRSHMDELDKKINYGQLNQSGGRIVKVNDEIIFTIGNYRSWPIAQNKDSIFGKILRINIKNKQYNILSMGHRNPQGLFYAFDKNLLFSSEHGPKGGDEVNLIRLDKKDELQNFGYPISSYGDHYDGKFRDEAPLNKSHIKYGFIEPIFFFKEGNIGPSEIIIEQNNILILSSLKANKLFLFKIDEKTNNLGIFDKLHVGERIRDIIKIDENYYLLSLENTPSIGLLKMALN